MTASRIKLAAAGAAFVGVLLALSVPAAEASPRASHGSQFGSRRPAFEPSRRAAVGQIEAFGHRFDHRFDSQRQGQFCCGSSGFGDDGLGDNGLPPAVGAPQPAPLFDSTVSAPNFYAPPLPFDASAPPPEPEIIELRPPRPWRGPRPIVVYGVGP
jgi:hypothetical protein